MKYYSLHNHTERSNCRFLDSVARAKDEVDKAIAEGYSGIAITEHENLSGAIDILKIRDSIKESHPDFKIILGNEIYLIPDDMVKYTEVHPYYHFIILAKDLIGWHQLTELSSRAWDRGYMERGTMRVPTTYSDIIDVVGKNPGHVFASTACVGGELSKDIISQNKEDMVKFLSLCLSVFGKDNFALEIQSSDTPDQIKVNATIVRLAKALSLPFIVTTDSHYLNKEDLPIQEAFLTSKGNADREVDAFYKYTYVQSLDEIRTITAASGVAPEDVEQAMANTKAIANSIQDFDLRCGTVVPSRPLPPFSVIGLSDADYIKYPAIKKFVTSDSEQDRFLWHLIEQGMKEKKMVTTPEILDRLNTELDVIWTVSEGLKSKVSAYFIMMKDIIDIAWEYSFVGVGRGSAAGFLINYIIGLTEINPLPYNLPYWRFLNKERFELPDIDTDLSPAQKEPIMEALRQYYGKDNVLNCATYKTASLKEAIKTSCRGLGISVEVAQRLSNSVPISRGHVYTLNECENGNNDLGLDPVPEVKQELMEIPHLYETVKKIENLKMNVSIHASAVYIFDHGYLEHNSLMRAPNGTRITAFDMDDVNAVSGLKVDLLYTDAENKLMKCVDLLLRQKQIQWQGSLRSTFDKYLRPEVLDYTSEDMWQKACNGQIVNLFQYETQVGAVGIRKAQPRNVMELATVNSAIRVKVDGEDNLQPIDRYSLFHSDISQWYQEMDQAGLTQDEQEIMKKHLASQFGCSLQQEDFMQLVMDPKIAGFTLKESNALRKCVAHKILADLAKQKDLFFADCVRQGTRKPFADYVWDKCIEPLSRYSFSVIHALAYSVVALQEMNLAYHYSPLYWDCACLSINAGNSATSFDGDESGESSDTDDDTDEDSSEQETVSVKSGAPDYGKVSKAICDMQHRGVSILLPDINTSTGDFLPDTSKKAILSSLSAICGVNDQIYQAIVSERPYTSLADFRIKCPLSDGVMVSLIKSGAFNAIENARQDVLLDRYLKTRSYELSPIPAHLSTVQLRKGALTFGLQGLLPFAAGIKMMNFRDAVRICTPKDSGNSYEFTRPNMITYFSNEVIPLLNSAKSEYVSIPGGFSVKKMALDKLVTAQIASALTWLNSPEGRTQYQLALSKLQYESLVSKYAIGTVADWEMESVNFYHDPHPLSAVDRTHYGISIFDMLPESPVPAKIRQDQGFWGAVYQITTIVGTVSGNNSNKHLVTLITPDGAVTVKMSAKNYAEYSTVYTKKKTNPNDPRIVYDDSWLKRGSEIMVNGFRRDNLFYARGARVDKDWLRYPVLHIEKILSDGRLELRATRQKNAAR
jgi:DNA polymerase-3 subunit alpha